MPTLERVLASVSDPEFVVGTVLTALAFGVYWFTGPADVSLMPAAIASIGGITACNFVGAETAAPGSFIEIYGSNFAAAEVRQGDPELLDTRADRRLQDPTSEQRSILCV